MKLLPPEASWPAGTGIAERFLDPGYLGWSFEPTPFDLPLPPSSLNLLKRMLAEQVAADATIGYQMAFRRDGSI